MAEDDYGRFDFMEDDVLSLFDEKTWEYCLEHEETERCKWMWIMYYWFLSQTAGEIDDDPREIVDALAEEYRRYAEDIKRVIELMHDAIAGLEYEVDWDTYEAWRREFLSELEYVNGATVCEKWSCESDFKNKLFDASAILEHAGFKERADKLYEAYKTLEEICSNYPCSGANFFTDLACYTVLAGVVC